MFTIGTLRRTNAVGATDAVSPGSVAQHFMEKNPIEKTRRRGERVIIITGKYAGCHGVVESNVFQKTVDHPEEPNYGFHIILDGDERVVTIQYDQVESEGIIYI